MREFIRQGDVCLFKVDNIEGKTEKKDGTILAYGEVTGHKHLLSGQILESISETERFIEVLDIAKLTHEEHNSLDIPKGKYKVLLQREVDLLGEVRQVID